MQKEIFEEKIPETLETKVDQIEKFLTSKEFIKYLPGSLLVDPEGKKYKVSAIDFANQGFILEREGKFYFFSPKELEKFERSLQATDYKGEIFWNYNEGWVGEVLSCDPSQKTVKIKRQDEKIFDYPFDEFIDKFTEIPDDVYTPFKNSVVQDIQTKKLAYVADINLERRSLTLEDCEVRIYDPRVGKVIWREPKSLREISVEEFYQRYKIYIKSVEEVFGNL